MAPKAPQGHWPWDQYRHWATLMQSSRSADGLDTYLMLDLMCFQSPSITSVPASSDKVPLGVDTSTGST
eukprot:4155879-Amphidinium_carterae.1